MPQLRLRPTTVLQQWGEGVSDGWGSAQNFRHVRNSSDHPMVVQEQMIGPHYPLYTAQKKMPVKKEGGPECQQIVHLKNGVKKGLKS